MWEDSCSPLPSLPSLVDAFCYMVRSGTSDQVVNNLKGWDATFLPTGKLGNWPPSVTLPQIL